MNLQLIEKRIERADGALMVHSIFPTIQGEGPFVGHPSVFVRLAGCNLQCPACDTDYTSNRELLSPERLLRQVVVQRGTHQSSLIVLTGGEPFRQSCGPFISLAINSGFKVQVETNGTLYDESLNELLANPFGLTVVCSPKTPVISQGLIDYGINALKYIVEAGKVDPEDGLPTDSLNFGARPARINSDADIYVQPMDSGSPDKNLANLAAAIESCQTFGYILCVQLHKIIGLP